MGISFGSFNRKFQKIIDFININQLNQMDYQRKFELISLEREICNNIDQQLPFVSDFNQQNLLVLASAYAHKIIHLWKQLFQDRQQFQKYIKMFQQDLINRSKAMLQTRYKPKQRNNTFSSTNMSVDRISYIQENQQQILNWSEIFQVLQQAFTENRQQIKGCELLQTLDYKLNFKQSIGGNNQLNFKIIFWLQQAHRYKDHQIKVIYQHLNMKKIEKQNLTFPNMVKLINQQLCGYNDMKTNYIKTIENLNDQITDLIAENTKKQIQNSSGVYNTGKYEQFSGNKINNSSSQKINAFRSFRSSELTVINNSSNKRRFLHQQREQRKMAQKSIEQILNEFIQLKRQNQQLLNLVEEYQQKIKFFQQNQKQKQKKQLDQSILENKYCISAHGLQTSVLQKVQRQLYKQTNLLSVLQTKIQKLLKQINAQSARNILSDRIRYQIPQIEQIQDIPQHLSNLNKQIQSFINRLQLLIQQFSGFSGMGQDHFKNLVKKIMQLVDKLLVNETGGIHNQLTLKNIQKLYIQIRKLELQGMDYLKKKQIGFKLTGNIIKIQKQLGVYQKMDKYQFSQKISELSKFLEKQRNFLIQLLRNIPEKATVQNLPNYQVYPTSKQTISSNSQCKLMIQKDKQIQQLKNEVNRIRIQFEKQRKSLEQQVQKIQKSKSQCSNVICEASKRISLLQREVNQLTRLIDDYRKQKIQQFNEMKKLKMQLKQQKQNKRLYHQKNNYKQNSQNQINILTIQNKQLEQQLNKQNQIFNKQRNILIEQVHKTGQKLQQIQKLAQRKIQGLNYSASKCHKKQQKPKTILNQSFQSKQKKALYY